MRSDDYNDNVFVNCPFDPQYRPLFLAIIFAILDCGFIPRCSREVDDATQVRLRAILDLVSDSRYGVHDLSRVELDDVTGLPRFNMPFELGIFFSAKHFGEGAHKRKQCIILDKTKYRYQKYISDISGVDVTAHKNSAKTAIVSVRNWLNVLAPQEHSAGRGDISQIPEVSARYQENLPTARNQLRIDAVH